MIYLLYIHIYVKYINTHWLYGIDDEILNGWNTYDLRRIYEQLRHYAHNYGYNIGNLKNMS